MNDAGDKAKKGRSDKWIRLPPVYLLVGPPAVGKSTTSRLLAASFDQSIHIPVDNLRDMVVSGLMLPSPQWSNELAQQISLARSSAAFMAGAYRAAGFTVVLDDFWEPNLPRDYQGLFAMPNMHKIVLMPRQSVAHQRNRDRAGEDPSQVYIDEGIEIAYGMLANAEPSLRDGGWLILDTTDMTIEAVVSEILWRTIRESD